MSDDTRSTAAGALLGSTLAALGLAIVDIGALLTAGGGLRAVVAALASAFVLASLGAVAAFSIVFAVRFGLERLDRADIEWSAGLCALVVSSFSVLGAQALVLRVLSGQGIRTAVIAASAALGVIVGLAVAVAARPLARRLAFTPSLRARTACVVTAGVGTLVSIVALAPGLVQELDVPGLSSAALPLAAALAVALVGKTRPAFVRAAAAGGLALAAGLAAHATASASGRVTRLIARETHASRFVLETLLPQPERALPPLPPGRGTCLPGVAPSTPARTPGKARQRAPDILLVTVDAMRWDHTTLGGYSRDTTPALSRRAASGAVFSSAMTPASSTRQTFRALFSGVYPSQVLPSTGASWWRVSFAAEQPTLAEHLHAAGYLTVSVTERGDAFDPNTGALDGFARRLWADSGNKGKERHKREARVRSQIDTLLAESRAERNQPLFAWAHLAVPHQPYAIGTPSPYGEGDLDLYDWAIQFVDSQIERLLATLEAEGRLARTFVVVTADHGQAFGEHGNRLHGHTVYQEETLIPLLIWGPGVVPGVRTAPTSILDLFPTLLELAGAPASPSVCGASIAAWLRDRSRVPSREVYMEQVPDKRPYFQIGYVRGRHKLVVTPAEEAFELFDLRSDRRELHDLSAARPELVEDLIDALSAFQKKRGMHPTGYGLH